MSPARSGGGVPFEKWHGLGNDFIVLIGGAGDVEPAVARSLCDRRRGVGGDGVLALSLEGEGWRMVVRNADGSRPQMCGNGLRCAVAALASREGLDEGTLTVLTDDGPKVSRYARAADERFDVEVDMGVATIGSELAHPDGAGGRRFLRVDTGNPHAVTFAPHEERDLEPLGRALQARVAGGVNVELCRVDGATIRVLVWERGVGRTLACGTGACAVAAAAVHEGVASSGVPLAVALEGGELAITVADDLHLTMRGPAVRVYAGELAPRWTGPAPPVG